MGKNILLMYSTHKPSQSHFSKIKEIAQDFEVVVANSEEESIDLVRNSEIIFGHRYLSQCLPSAHRLKWVQTTAGGIDRLPLKLLREKGVLLTRTTVSSSAIARHAYTLAWALVRRFPEYIFAQKQQKWNTTIETLPRPKTALILGFGHIGRELLKLLKRDKIKVWGVKRMIDDHSKMLCDKLFDTLSWRQVLPQVDLCFLCLPTNKYTKGIFDESALCALPKHAVIVNVGRGDSLDTRTLIRLLKENSLGGAGLDVLYPQPPFPNDPIWETPNLIITPYVAARYPERAKDIEEYFEYQLKRYMNKGALENIIDWNEVKIDYETLLFK